MTKGVLATIAVAVFLVGCGAVEQVSAMPVPLLIEDAVSADDRSCVLAYRIVDVVADPATGTPRVAGDSEALRWKKGFTAWRAGTEVVVLDPSGDVVLTTGSRYWMCQYGGGGIHGYLVGDVFPCPFGELGGGLIGPSDPGCRQPTASAPGLA